MAKNAYNVEGDFQMGRIRQHFNIEVVGENEDAAREHALTDLGSRHGVERRLISITSINALDAEAADPITRKRLGL